MAFQMVRNFFGQGSPSRSGAHEPVIENESFGNQGGTAHYDTRDVGKTAIDSNWSELARENRETNKEGRKPHSISGCVKSYCPHEIRHWISNLCDTVTGVTSPLPIPL